MLKNSDILRRPQKVSQSSTYRVGNKFSDTINVPFVSNWFMSVKIAVNCKF